MKHNTLSDPDGSSTSDRGTPVVTHVRVGRGLVKVTNYQNQDKVVREEKKRERLANDVGSISSYGSSQPPLASPTSGRDSNASGRPMPSWLPKFKKSKKDRKISGPLSIPEQSARDAFSVASTSSLTSSSRHEVLSVPEVPRASFPAKDNYLAPPGHIPTPPSSPGLKQPRALRPAHSDGDMWTSIAHLESELVARYGRGAVPQFNSLRQSVKAPARDLTDHYEFNPPEVPSGLSQINQQSIEPIQRANQSPVSQARPRTLSQRKGVTVYSPGTFLDDLDIHSPIQVTGRGLEPTVAELKSEVPEGEEDGSDDGALAYLQALGLEPPESISEFGPSARPQSRLLPASSVASGHTRSHSPTSDASHLEYARQDALKTGVVNPPPADTRRYSSRKPVPHSDPAITQYASFNGVPVDGSYPESPIIIDPHDPDSPPRHQRKLPPRPPPPSTFTPYTPTSPVPPPNITRASSPDILPREPSLAPTQSSGSLRHTPSLRVPRASLAPPVPHLARWGSRSSQLTIPLVRVRISSPNYRGTLRALPALVMLDPGARAIFAAASWAQMVAYCARNAGVAIARRGNEGFLRVAIEERMAELTTPGGGRGVGDEEVGFGLGYYVSVDLRLEGESPSDDRQTENSVPVATLSVPLPATLGELAIIFRERKDISKALS